MLDLSRYIDGGNVSGVRIATDIKRGILTKSDIIELAENPKIVSAFFGTMEGKRKNRSEWTKQYLDEISCMPVAACFNKEFMLYLYEVSEYVGTSKNKKPAFKAIAVAVAVLLVAAIVILVVK